MGNPYTICGYYEDDGQAYCDCVEAASPVEAAKMGPIGCVITSVFAGQHDDLLPAEDGVCGEGNQNGADDTDLASWVSSLDEDQEAALINQLDEMVHDRISLQATSINNEGIVAQAIFLGWSQSDLADMIADSSPASE